MNRHFRTVLLGSVIVLPISLTASGAAAQVTVTEAPDPVVGAVPAGPSGAHESHDQVATGQLMKIEELSRQISGGVTQIFTSAQTQEQSLGDIDKAIGQIQGAAIGTKTFPVLNGPTETAARQGGTGLTDMAGAALAGSPTGPADVLAALQVFTTQFGLDKAFALIKDPAVSKQLAASAAAMGAVAAATGEASYNRANLSMARLDGYITALQASADLKTSVDINTRVMIEVAQQLNESLRTQAALTSTAATYFMILGRESAKGYDPAAWAKLNR
jgi:hypothetical protein